jgi:V/A-type H+-transporting ATPase subunit G/H
MAVALLKDIKSIEKIAEQKELEAQHEARDIIAAARNNASALLEEKHKSAEEEAKEVVSTYEKKALKDIAQMQQDIQAQCQDIRDNAATKLEKVTDFIVGRIVK